MRCLRIYFVWNMWLNIKNEQLRRLNIFAGFGFRQNLQNFCIKLFCWKEWKAMQSYQWRSQGEGTGENPPKWEKLMQQTEVSIFSIKFSINRNIKFSNRIFIRKFQNFPTNGCFSSISSNLKDFLRKLQTALF